MPSVVVCAEERHEVMVSDCPSGCKIYACKDGHAMVIHSKSYNCGKAKV